MPLIYALAYFLYLLQKGVPTPEIKFIPPIFEVEKKEIETPIEIPHEETIEEHIQRLWGTRGNEAVAVFKSENFWNEHKAWKCDRVGAVNFDGTYDVGLAQINTVHGRPDSEMKNCHKNIDFAYKLYREREGWGMDGFSAWYSYIYKRHLAFL